VNTAGIISANINKSEYFFIIDGGSVDGVIDDPVVVLVAFWILNPKVNAAIPIESSYSKNILRKSRYENYWRSLAR
jgi:cell shape-determining protein MreC